MTFSGCSFLKRSKSSYWPCSCMNLGAPCRDSPTNPLLTNKRAIFLVPLDSGPKIITTFFFSSKSGFFSDSGMNRVCVNPALYHGGVGSLVPRNRVCVASLICSDVVISFIKLERAMRLELMTVTLAR